MILLTKLLALTLLLHYSNGRALDSTKFVKKWHIEGDSNFVSPFINNQTYVFANCTTQGIPEESICDATLEYQDKSKETQKCTLPLFSGKDITLTRDLTRMKVSPFGENKIVMTYHVREDTLTSSDLFLIITMVNMDTCETADLGFKYDRAPYIFLTDIVRYEDGFDLIFGNDKVCGENLTQCRITFNADGFASNTSMAFKTDLALFQVFPVLSSSPDRGFFLTGFTGKKPEVLRVTWMSVEGEETVLAQANILSPYHAPSATSGAHDTLGVCWYNQSHRVPEFEVLQCMQFDDDAEIKLNVTFKPDDIVHGLAVHNLVEGGLLVMTARCDTYEAGWPTHDCKGFNVTKVHKDGHTERLYKISFENDCTSSTFDPQLVHHVSDNKDEICYHFTTRCYTLDSEGKRKGVLTYSQKCVTKKNLETTPDEL